jgi:hypothetical protein
MTLAIMRGGAHDGKTTDVAEGVRRLLTVSDAPGLLDVYEIVDDETHVAADVDDPELEFVLVAQESAAGVAPELLHMPSPQFSDDGDGIPTGDVTVDPVDLAFAEQAATETSQDVQ